MARWLVPRQPGSAAHGSWRSRNQPSEVPPRRLLALDRLEERLEVARAEAGGTVTLDDLEEDRRAIAERLGEHLEEVALVVAVDEDPEALEVVKRLVDLADPLGDLVVVRVGRAQEPHAARLELGHASDDVAR